MWTLILTVIVFGSIILTGAFWGFMRHEERQMELWTEQMDLIASSPTIICFENDGPVIIHPDDIGDLELDGMEGEYFGPLKKPQTKPVFHDFKLEKELKNINWNDELKKLGR